MADFEVRRGSGVWLVLGLAGVLAGCEEPSASIAAEPLAARAVPVAEASPVAAPVLVTSLDRPQWPNSEPLQLPLESLVRPKGRVTPRSKARVAPPPVSRERAVAIGSVMIAGGDVSNASRVLAGLRGGFQSCYRQQELGGAGRVRFAVAIGADGQVTEMAPSSSGDLTQPVVRCAGDLVRSATFVAPASGSAKLEFPVIFWGAVARAAVKSAPQPRATPGLAPAARPRGADGKVLTTL